MATRQGSGGYSEDGTFNYSWTGITEADEGNPIIIPSNLQGISFQVTGTFGGGTFQLQGSNDGVNYLVIKDSGGTDIASTTTVVWRVINPPKFIKPKATAGAAASVGAFIHGLGN